MSFLTSFWSLKSRPPLQPALRVDFGTLSCCMLRHLLCFVLCMFSRLPRWHFRPPSLSLGALLSELSGVSFASGTTYCHAVCILPRFWLTLCFYIAAQVQLNPGKPFKCLESGCSSACFPRLVLAHDATGVIAVAVLGSISHQHLPAYLSWDSMGCQQTG